MSELTRTQKEIRIIRKQLESSLNEINDYDNVEKVVFLEQTIGIAIMRLEQIKG